MITGQEGSKEDRNDNELSLSAICSQKCLKEAEFYFPLNKASTKQLSLFLSNHRNNSPFCARNVAQVKLPMQTTLKGMMHGFIDLIFENARVMPFHLKFASEEA